LYTQTKLRGVGIDIRSDGGYVVGPQSIINNKHYEYANNSSNNNLIEMPAELILWLIEGLNGNNKITTENLTITNKNDKKLAEIDLVFMIDDKKLSEILDTLPKEYNNNYLKWLSVTNVLKG
jgi:hypothetical protein